MTFFVVQLPFKFIQNLPPQFFFAEESHTEDKSTPQVEPSLTNAGARVKRVAKKQDLKETPKLITKDLPVETSTTRSSRRAAIKELDNVTPVLPKKRGQPQKVDKAEKVDKATEKNSNNKVEQKQNVSKEPATSGAIETPSTGSDKPRSRGQATADLKDQDQTDAKKVEPKRGRMIKQKKAVAEEKRAVSTPATTLTPAATTAGRKRRSVSQDSTVATSEPPVAKNRVQRSLKNKSAEAAGTLKNAESEVNKSEETPLVSAPTRISSRRGKKTGTDKTDELSSKTEPVKQSTAVGQSKTAKDTTVSVTESSTSLNVAVENPKRCTRQKTETVQATAAKQTTATEETTAVIVGKKSVPPKMVKAATKRGQAKALEPTTAGNDEVALFVHCIF